MKFSVHFLAIFLLVIFSASDPSEGTFLTALKTVGSSIRGAARKSYHSIATLFSDLDPKIDVRIRKKHKKPPQASNSKGNLPLCSTVKKIPKTKLNNNRRKKLLPKDKTAFLPTAEPGYDDYFMEYLSPSVEGLGRTLPDNEMIARRKISYMGQKKFPYARIDRLRDKYRRRLQARPRVSSPLDPELDDTEYSEQDERAMDLYDDMYENGNSKQKYSERHEEKVKKNPNYVNTRAKNISKNQQTRLKAQQNKEGLKLLDTPEDTIEDLDETKIGELSTTGQVPSYNKQLALVDSFMANPLSVHSTWISNETDMEKNISSDNITRESSSNQKFNVSQENTTISTGPITNSSLKQNLSTSLKEKKKEIIEKNAKAAADGFSLNQTSTDEFKDNMEDENLVTDPFVVVDSNFNKNLNHLLNNYKENELEGPTEISIGLPGNLHDKMEIEEPRYVPLANPSFRTSLKDKKKAQKLNGSAKFNTTGGSSNHVKENLEEEALDGAPLGSTTFNQPLQRTLFNKKKVKKSRHHKFQSTDGLLSSLERVREEQKQIANVSTTTLANSETTEETEESELAEKKSTREKDFDTLIV